jgi:hypothetical protein
VAARLTRVRERARAIGRKLAPLAYVPLRLPGIVLVVAAVLLLRFSRERADYVLYPASLAALGLLGLCAVFTTLATLALWRSVRKIAASGVPDQLETTLPLTTAFRFRRLVAWPLVETRMAWADPSGVRVELVRDGGWFGESITPGERGRHTHVVRRFTVEDIFGLTAITFRVAWEQPLRIVPARTAGGLELALGHATGDAFSHPEGRAEGDLIEMRKYGHGDPLRYVLWKTFARTRRLLVRMPERAVAPMPTTSAFLVAGPGDEAAAATARLYIESGLLGADFVFAADGATAPTTKPGEAVEQIIDSVAARADGGRGLDAFRREVDPIRLGHCVVFAPPIDGAWRERVAAFSQGLPSPATVIIGVEGPLEDKRRKWVARLLLQPDHRLHAQRRDLDAIRSGLEAGGVQVKILHRETGQVL